MKKYIVFIIGMILINNTAFGLSLFSNKSSKQSTEADAAKNQTLINYSENFYAQHKVQFIDYYEKHIRSFYESGYGASAKNPIEFPYPEGVDTADAIGNTNLMAIQFCEKIPDPEKRYIKISVLGTKSRQKITAGALDLAAKAMGGVRSQGMTVTGKRSITVLCTKALNQICTNTCASNFCVSTESVGVACTACLKNEKTKKLKVVERCIEDFSMKFVYHTDDAMIQQRRRTRDGVLGRVGSALSSVLPGANSQMQAGNYVRQQYQNGQQYLQNGQQQLLAGQQQAGTYAQQQYQNGQQQLLAGQQQAGNYTQQQIYNSQQQAYNGQQQAGAYAQQQYQNGQQQLLAGQQQAGNYGQQQLLTGQQQAGNYNQQQMYNGQQQAYNGQQQAGMQPQGAYGQPVYTY